MENNLNNKNIINTEYNEIKNNLNIVKKETENIICNSYTKQINTKNTYSFVVVSILGSGSFGIVYKVFDKSTQKYYAMKIPKKSKTNKNTINNSIFNNNNNINNMNNINTNTNDIDINFYNKAKYYLNNEINALLNIKKHNNIINMIDYEYDLYILMECYDITLLSIFKNKTNIFKNNIFNSNISLNNVFTKKYIKRNIDNIAIRLLTALEHIHKNNYVYKDMKPENILVDKGRLILIDFGGSVKANNKYKTVNNYIKSHNTNVTINNSNKINNVTTNNNVTNVDKKEKRTVIGTLRYCSINCHKMRDITYLDDIENLLYVCIWLYEGRLPWEDITYKINSNTNINLNNSNINNINIYNSNINNINNNSNINNINNINNTNNLKNTNDKILELKLKYRNEVLETNSTTLTSNVFLAKMYKYICISQVKYDNICKVYYNINNTNTYINNINTNNTNNYNYTNIIYNPSLYIKLKNMKYIEKVTYPTVKKNIFSRILAYIKIGISSILCC
ncbi:CK1 [Ecytonucleospora hepatopenaei]|uniref:non-specific serine/threonine protein kinase n=1 Tax=Ecytonucleospora hepatopenaei TaxID=646526 RepID=A0A1W0E916_9MICR|nr:CK1 [Ecytonucleospora hepatopenaei]